MEKPESNTIVTVPKPQTVEMVKRPYPSVKPGSVLVKTEIAAVCVDDRMYTDHVHEWFDSPVYGMGHEGVGTVLEAPESRTFMISLSPYDSRRSRSGQVHFSKERLKAKGDSFEAITSIGAEKS